MASYHLTGIAVLCYGHLEEKMGRPSWGEFQQLISNHFGPPTRTNPFGELISVHSYSIVADYNKRFLEHLTWRSGASSPTSSPIQHCRRLHQALPRAPNAEERDIFTNNLGEPVRRRLRWPASLEPAMDLAVSFEHLHNVPTAALTAQARPVRQPWSSLGPGRAPSDVTGSAPALAFKKLTGAEMDDRHAKGLCFNCDEKFMCGHHCKRLFYIQTVNNDNESIEDCEDIQISLLAVTGVPMSDTMQVVMCIGGRKLVLRLTLVAPITSSTRILSCLAEHSSRIHAKGDPWMAS